MRIAPLLVVFVLIAGCVGQTTPAAPPVGNATVTMNATVPEQPPAREFIFDVVYPGFGEEHLQEIQKSHITNLTLPICWSQVETANETFDWKFPEERIAKYNELGMPPAGVILDWWNCRPDWLSGVDENSDVFISELNHFAEVSAAKYGPKIKYWMIGNELSGLHWNGRYSPHAVLLYKNVSAAVKRGWPDAQVGTRLAFDDWDENITNWAPFLDEVKGSSDWVGVQAYPVGAGFHPGDHALKQAIEMVRKRSGGLPVWVTETGVSLCQCERRGAPINSYKECMKGNESCQQWVTEERRGIWMRELIHDAWDANAFGISVYTWSLDTYSLIDQETYWEKDYGFKPLPVLEVFRQAYAELQTLQE